MSLHMLKKAMILHGKKHNLVIFILEETWHDIELVTFFNTTRNLVVSSRMEF